MSAAVCNDYDVCRQCVLQNKNEYMAASTGWLVYNCNERQGYRLVLSNTDLYPYHHTIIACEVKLFGVLLPVKHRSGYFNAGVFLFQF